MNLPSVAIWGPVALVVAVAMDFWAALLHGKVWHRRLWWIHRSHHRPRHGTFESNDALSTLHAPAAIALILYGCAGAPGILREVLFGVGLGASTFGLAYLVVHDGLVHGRLPVRGLRRIPYLDRVVRAHRVHHSGRDGRPPYGLFFGPFELARHRRLTSSREGAPARVRAPSAPRPMDRALASPRPKPEGVARR